MRVLVTRSLEDSRRTAARLAAKGHEALVAPATLIVPTGDPQPAGSYDALVVTSAHATDALASMENKQLPVFAVGPHTASAVRQAGFDQIMTAEGDARSLSGLILATPGIGRGLMHVTGRHHKDEPAASLREAGFQVATWKAYEAREMNDLPAVAIEAIRTGQIGAALHYSRRSADIFLGLARDAGLLSSIGGFPHLCLSEDVAQAFAGLGLTAVPARRPDEEALFDLLNGLP